VSGGRWPPYRRADGRSRATFQGRRLFLDAVAEFAPQVVTHLRRGPYAAFVAALEADPPRPQFIERSVDPVYGARVAGGTGERVQQRGEWTLPEWTGLYWEPRTIPTNEPGITTLETVVLRERPCWSMEVTAYPELVSAFRDALREWGAAYHLNDTWCLDVAQKTIRWWYHVEYLDAAGEPPGGFADPDYLGPPVAPFRFRGFDPEQDDPSEWGDELRKAGDAYLERRLADLESQNRTWQKLKEVYGEPSSARYHPVRADKRSSEHFIWVALYQAGGLSPEQVAVKRSMGAHGTGRGNVARKISEKAQLMGLTLRPPRKNQYR
jgi:hypothetical protein